MNPLLTKLVWSGLLDIGLNIVLHVQRPQLRHGPINLQNTLNSVANNQQS